MRTKVYVAGHRGMVGSALVRGLETKGYNHIITKTRSELDLCNATAVEGFFSKEQPELVFMAAARVGGILANNRFPADFIRENLLIQTHLIQASFAYGARRVLFLGSSCIYPRLAKQPIKETALLSGSLEPTNRAYALAKIAGIEMCWSYNRQHFPHSRTSFLAAMPTNLYGTGDNYHPTNSHVIPGLIRRFHEAKVNQAQEVIVWGTGKPLREFMHADDMAAACIHLMELPDPTWQALTAADRNDGEAPLVNIGVDRDVSIAELAKLIAEVVNYKGQIRFDPTVPDGTPRKLMSSAKLYALYPYQARTLREGLAQTYREYCELLD
ncbi:MAG: GDP-L-fucose synthase [Betaproteobacteria bacterium]|nr:GDP-L-fucose synthase [Betaproteobacteria bacterium]